MVFIFFKGIPFAYYFYKTLQKELRIVHIKGHFCRPHDTGWCPLFIVHHFVFIFLDFAVKATFYKIHMNQGDVHFLKDTLWHSYFSHNRVCTVYPTESFSLNFCIASIKYTPHSRVIIPLKSIKIKCP